MRTNDIIIEAKKKISSQEKFARENFSGLDDIAQRILDGIEELKKIQDDFIKYRTRKKGPTTDEEYDAYDAEREDVADGLSSYMSVIALKLSTAVGHALNGKSTKTLKDIIHFMDTYGISDRILHNGLTRIANTRMTEDGFLDLAAGVAAQVNDLAFIKELEKFAKKNRGRKNTLEYLVYDHRQYGVFSRMQDLSNRRKLALEALVHGSKDVYQYLTNGKGLGEDYLIRYIEAKERWVKKLTKKEVEKLIEIEPDMMDAILKHMPENLPDDVVDIFMF